MKKSLFLVTLTLLAVSMTIPLFSVSTGAQETGDPIMSEPMMGGRMRGPGMVGQGMMGPRMMPMGGMGRMGLLRRGLMGVLHQWGTYFFTKKDQLGMTEAQFDQIESILGSHVRYVIKEDASLRILFIEIEELLVKEKVDLGEIERRLRTMDDLKREMEMEGIRTLERAMAVLTPEQQRKMKAFFK